MGGGTEAGSLLLRAEGHLYHCKTKEGYSHWCVNIIARSQKSIQFVHMGLKHASREKKLYMVIFLIFVQ